MRILRFFLLPVLATIVANRAFAQPSIGGRPISEQFEELGMITPLSQLPVLTLPSVDMTKVRQEDKKDLVPNRFAVGVPVNRGLQDAGLWEQLPNGDRIWRLAISSPGAIALIPLYEEFFLPPGAVLYVYNSDRSIVFGGYTSANNPKEPSWGFSSSMILGQTIVFEYYEPALVAGQGRLYLEKISHVYAPEMRQDPELLRQGAYQRLSGKGFGDGSPTCAININCSTKMGKDWQKEKRAVARILLIQRNGNAGWCSGSLINNTALDEKPYFYSANHCVGDVDYGKVQYHFDYESPSCNNQDVTPNIVVGSTLKMTNYESDHWLVELSSLPPNPYFLGWSREDKSPGTGIGISHPSGDIKKIHAHSSAVSNTQEVRVTNPNNPEGFDRFPIGSHWLTTVTEGYLAPGSSGSALISQSNRLVYGTLHAGGPFNCDPNAISANYGKLSWAWDRTSSPSTRLKDWLDPLNKGYTELAALDPLELNPNIIISEVASGQISNRDVRFVEIFNANPDRKINLNNLSLVRYVDGNPNNFKVISLRANFDLKPLHTFVIANAAFDPSWGLPAQDFISSELGDGNDVYVLTNNGAKVSDVYGQLGVNGSGTFWDYTNKVVTRKSFVKTVNNANFTDLNFYEWKVSDFSLANITPGSHSVIRPKTDLLISKMIYPQNNSLSCEDSIAPAFVVFNNGSDSIASFSITATINGKTSTINSQFGIATMNEQIVDFANAGIFFEAKPDSVVQVNAIVSVAGDEVPANDTAVSRVKLSSQKGASIVVEIKTDDNPEQTFWEVMLNNYAVATRDFVGENKRTVYRTRLCLDTAKCYLFRIRDRANNGLSSAGYFRVFRGRSTQPFIENANFSSNREVVFCAKIPPSDPTECRAVPQRGNIVRFSWKDNSDNEDGFLVQRQFPALTGVWENIAITGPNVTSIDDALTTSQAKLQVIYRVAAFRNTSTTFRAASAFCEIPEEITALDSETRPELIAFPNPTQGKISFQYGDINTKTTASVYNSSGLLIKTIGLDFMNGKAETKDLGLAKGLYILQITFDNHTLTHRFVVE